MPRRVAARPDPAALTPTVASAKRKVVNEVDSCDWGVTGMCAIFSAAWLGNTKPSWFPSEFCSESWLGLQALWHASPLLIR